VTPHSLLVTAYSLLIFTLSCHLSEQISFCFPRKLRMFSEETQLRATMKGMRGLHEAPHLDTFCKLGVNKRAVMLLLPFQSDFNFLVNFYFYDLFAHSRSSFVAKWLCSTVLFFSVASICYNTNKKYAHKSVKVNER
jgi:hypothetical protein